MHICYVCWEYPPALHGGIGSVTQLLARGMAAAGHAVHVVGLYRGATERVVEHDGAVEVWRLALSRGATSSFVLARRQLREAIREVTARARVDLVEAPDYLGWSAGLKGLGLPVVVRAHASRTFIAAELGRRPNPRIQRLEARSLRTANGWCAVSAYLAKRTRDLLGVEQEADVLPNAVVLPEETPMDLRDRSLVVFTGTMNHRKGLLYLLRSWPSVRASHPRARLEVLGKPGSLLDGSPIGPAIDRLVPDPGAFGVRFLGHVPRATVLDRLRTAAVAVFPSLVEGFGMAPIEAMAAGCPTVYTKRGPGPEIIDHGIDGLLVDPEDPKEIAAAIIGVLDDSAFGSRLGASARQRVARDFELDGWIRRNEGFYLRVLSACAPPGS